ncbi:Gliding motility-associated ABC transporter permease protein GldF [hydrothermal vent metagenome]|uniref:Gliding motility-associated ABC transporter permease protein GldF n=1 Tax=hydrothermal vent metagenome TaxID=652676 RepID=A0A3B0VQS1_9ZZZZ
MNKTFAIIRRELQGYFSTPIAYVFIVIFLILSGVFAFYLGGLYERNQADLSPFFNFHPWLYLFLVPAVSMRMWSEERRSGNIELLMTLPVTQRDLVLGKFLSAWLFIAIALFLTFPIWISINYLGNPDNGLIIASYIGSLLLAGAFLAIGSCISVASKNQVIAFIVTAVICFIFLLAGLPMVLDFFAAWLPQILVDSIASTSFLTHYASINKGVLDLGDLFYFAMVISIWLFATSIVLDMKKAD